MAQFVGCLEGMGDACRALDFPIVSGNVSLYNESKATGGGSAILPTPAIGGVGLIDDYAKMATIGFKAEGDAIFLIGDGASHLGQSLWLRELHGRDVGPPPPVDLNREKVLGEAVRTLLDQGVLTAVHDVSDGGLLVALTEMALAGARGCLLHETNLNPGFWFGERQGRYIVTASSENAELVENRLHELDAGPLHFGVVQGGSIVVSDHGKQELATIPLTDLRNAHQSFFRDWMES
jgi:phosphoribosylformylglycinamidine synthase